MKIKVNIEQDIPTGLYCKKKNGVNCERLTDSVHSGSKICALFDRYLQKLDNQTMKCDECLKATCDAIKEGST